LQVDQTVESESEIFLTTTAGDISVDQSISTSGLNDNILIVAGDELNLNAELQRGANSAVLDVSNLNPDVGETRLLLEPSDDGQELAFIDTDNFTQDFIYTFGRDGEQDYTTTVFFGIELESYEVAGIEPNFELLDAADLPFVDARLTELTNLLEQGFESRSFYEDSNGGQAFIQNTSQPIVDGDSASFTLEFLNNNPEFRSVAFVFNDAGINVFDNAAEPVDGLRDLNVVVEDFQGLANIGTPPVIFVDREEFQIADRIEFTPAVESSFFQSVVLAEDPLFTQTVYEKFFVVVYFESQAEADNFESAFEKLEASDTGEKDYDQAREILKKFDSLDFKTDDENEALDINKIRQIFEKADLDLDGDDEEWQKVFQEWLEKKEFDDETPEVPRGVFKIIEVENGKAIIQGDDIDRRFVPEPDNESQTKDYPFEVPSDDANGPEPDGGLLELKPPGEAPNDGASMQPMSNRMARWTTMLDGGPAVADQAVDEIRGQAASNHPPTSPDFNAAAAATTSALGLLGLVVQRNSAINRSAADEIEDFAKAKARQPERNIFSKAARFVRRNRQAFQDSDQD
jgi:hypothetical protein